MTASDLPDDLAALERDLGRRPLQDPPAGLRLRVQTEVRCARRRERRLLLAAAAAVVAVVGALGFQGAAARSGTWTERLGSVQDEARALEGLGLAAADVRRLVAVAHAVELAPLAPPMGSGPATLPGEEGP